MGFPEMLSPGIVLQRRYRIKRLLARGGMGAVYEAEAVHLRNAPVAVKETFFSEDRRSLREQFEREAATLARLRHPALPQVKDHFIEGGGQFLVMDFIEGDDLGALLERRLKETGEPFEFRQVIEWADRLLDALSYIHSQYPPVIHRDIKPQNLKLTPRSELFLIDFGLAKDATTPTRPGQSVYGFTLEFAPPEQIKGEGTDPRSDLYSLGATLYALATGKLPPDARVREEAVVKHLMPDLLQPAHQINPRIPFAFAAALAKSMSLDRERRYQSALEMRHALRQIKQAIEAETAETERREAERRRGQEEERERLAEERRIGREEAAAVAPVAGRKTPRVALGAIAAVTLIVLLAYALRSFINSTGDKAAGANPPIVTGGGASPLSSPTVPAADSPPRAEAMRYWLRLEKDGGKRVSGLDPLPAGERFQLHFEPATSGYLYLIAPDETRTPTAFVTKRRIETRADFQFPSGDNWINVGEGASFTVIFSPELLKELPFLNGKPRQLTTMEQSALRDFQPRLAPTAPEIKASDGGAIVTAQKRNDEPLVFEIGVSRKTR